MAAAAVPYLLAASAAVSAIGAIQQGQAAKSAANYNATLEQMNARAARQDAADQAAQVDRENYLRLGAIRANQGKSGGAAGEGSVLDILSDAASQGELERQYVLKAGERKAFGHEASANLDRAQGRNAQTGSYLKAGSELLSGGANYAYTKNWKRT